MKPKQVGEQHRTLRSPEYNYQHKVVAQKKKLDQKKLAEEEIVRYLREEVDDTATI